MKAKCLVTGGAGFIGSHIVDGLLKKGFRVRVLDNLSTGKIENLSALRGSLEFQQGDLRNQRHVAKAVKGMDYVFHLAANRAVQKSVDNPMETNEVNVTGTLRLLLASRAEKIKRFLFTSSSAAYGDTQKFPCRETDRPMPESPYGASKVMGEYYCSQFSKLYGLSTVSLRYFNVFGPRQNPESRYSAVIPIFIECLLKHRSPDIHWDGKQLRDFLYIDNVVHANLISMNARGVDGEVFNIGCQEEFSVLDIFDGIKKILNIPDVKPRFTPKRPGDVRRTLADISKAKRMLKFKVQTRFFPGLEKTVRWFLESRKQPSCKRPF